MYNREIMRTSPEFPAFEDRFPELNQFIHEVVSEYRLGKIKSWDDLDESVNAFFTPEQMDRMEALVPGWCKMASYRHGVTLVHVLCVFLGLFMLPEFSDLNPYQQGLIKWTVLLHDLEKEIDNGRRDPTHAFRSGASAAKRLASLGFSTIAEQQLLLDSWSELTASSVTRLAADSEPVQDNQRLPEILRGIEMIFGKDSPATLIVKTILLHMSINVVKEWPQAAPLSDAEITNNIDRDVLPLLRVMMLADNEGWVLFYADHRSAQRAETLQTFDRLAGLIL
jgi:hypothetical protein